MRYTTDPQQAEVDTATVDVNLTQVPDGWAVTVVFVRRPPTTPINGAAVDVEVLDTGGVAMPVLDRPKGPLAEAGGSLITSANAGFRFGGSAAPREIVVRWAGASARFRVVGQ